MAIVSTIARDKPNRTYPELIILESIALLVHCGSDLPVVATTLSFAMGLHNPTSTPISNAKVRTTHMSVMATDLGIEAALLIRGTDRLAVLSRCRLHALTICGVLAGGFAAALLHTLAPAAAIVISTIILMAAGVTELCCWPPLSKVRPISRSKLKWVAGGKREMCYLLASVLRPQGCCDDCWPCRVARGDRR